MIDTSKRKLLLSGLSVSASAIAFNLFPPSIRKALAIPANNRTGTIKDVEHVVILMQENRSFDNYFGTMRGVRGFGDRFTIPLPNGLNVLQQLNEDGKQILPYHLDQTIGNAQRVKGTPHSWLDARNAWDKGRMFQWPKFKEDQSMGYFTEQEAPFQYALADAFTICDNYFCSLHGGTNTNRLFHWTGTNGATVNNNVVVVNNAWDTLKTNTDINKGGFSWKTYPERLQEAGVSWMVYQNMPDNFTDNPLLGFRQYRQANINSGKPVYHDEKDNPAFDFASDDPGNPLYKGIANTMPDDGLLGSFKDDILNGKLPQVSWVVAPAEYSEHPGPSSPIQGGWYIQEVLDALTANPEVWSKTVLIVNFDENDGFFDHLPPPCAPSLKDSTPGQAYGKSTLSDSDMAYEYYIHDCIPGSNMPSKDSDCYGPGPRVPMFIISPWSRGGWVNSQQFDHTSVLRFLEARFGVAETNISPFRRAVFGDLTSAFNFKTPNNEKLPNLAGRKTQQQADQLRNDQSDLTQIEPPSNQIVPVQKTGSRPSRALPYELHVSASIDVLAKKATLIFANSGTQAAVFHVYDKLHLDRVPQRYVVEPNKQLSDIWDLSSSEGHYDLWVLGPNGFHRQFGGDITEQLGDAAAQPEIRVCYDIANDSIYVTLMNTGVETISLTARAKAYQDDGPWTVEVDGGCNTDLHWALKDSDRWYDFLITSPDYKNFSRRFAGRVENGSHSITDPAMGLIDL